MPAATYSSQDVIALAKKHLIGNYTRYPVCLVRGEGSWVWDAEGTRYLDFFPGWGCDILGHCPPRVVAAVQEQVAQVAPTATTVVIDGETGYLVPPRDPEAVASRCAELLRQPVLRGRMSRRGQRRVESFTWLHVARLAEAAYSRALGQRAPLAARAGIGA